MCTKGHVWDKKAFAETSCTSPRETFSSQHRQCPSCACMSQPFVSGLLFHWNLIVWDPPSDDETVLPVTWDSCCNVSQTRSVCLNRAISMNSVLQTHFASLFAGLQKKFLPYLFLLPLWSMPSGMCITVSVSFTPRHVTVLTRY